MSKKKIASFLFIYSILFFIIILLGYLSFFQNNKSFIWKPDGAMQHYPALVYLGSYIREILQSVFSGSPSIPLYDFRIGMGDDIMVPLLTHSANIDFFNLLTILVPTSKTEVFYNIIIILRIYFSGLSFSFFCYKIMKTPSWAIVICSLTYAFCGWAIFSAVRHPSFMIAMVYLPIIVLGLEYILKNKKPYVFIVSIFLSALAGFYFLYMETLFLLIYTFIRIRSMYKMQYFKHLLFYGKKTAANYLVGLMMSSIFFIPFVTAQLNSSRKSQISNDNLLYFNEPLYYIKIFINFITNGGSQIWFGMAAIIFPSIVLLFFKKTKYRTHFIIGFVTLLLIRFIPFGNYLFNGFGYISFRWTFLFAFVLSLILAYTLPHMISLTKRFFKACFVLIFIYGLMTLLTIAFFDKNIFTYSSIGFCFLTISTFCLLIPANNRRFKIISLTFVVVTNLILNAHLTFHEEFKNYSSEFYKNGKIQKKYDIDTKASDFIEIKDSIYREELLDTPMNASILNDYYGVTEYWSMMNPSYPVGMLELENRQQHSMLWQIRGLDNRTILHTLTSIKYISADYGKRNLLPFGYKKIVQKGKGKNIQALYINQYPLPIGYTYSNVISSKEYNQLTALYKQEALLQAIVLPDEFVNHTINTLHFNTTSIPYTSVEYNGLQWENGFLSVNKKNASLTIHFTGLPNSETYLRMTGLDTDDFSESYITLKGKNVLKEQYARFWKSDFYFNKRDYLINMGYDDEAQNTITVTFPQKGAYKLADIQIFCYPMENYPNQVAALQEDILENVQLGTNQLTGEITLETDKILCLSIPYSKGWTATVDGKKQSLLQANTMFMALPLTKGYHEIELNYITPGLKAGIILSLLGIFIFIGICIYYKKMDKLKV